MFSRFKPPTVSYCKLTEGIRRELKTNLESKGIIVKNLDIEVNKTNVNISLYINESSAK